MSSNSTVLDPPPVATCPACGGELAAAAAPCSACEVRARDRNGQHPAVNVLIGLAWFCTAVVILWFFGSLAMAPWGHDARVGPMPLPGGGQFDLTLGRGASARCAVRVARDGKSTEVVILQTACNTMAAHRWLTDNRQLPQFQGAALSMPYTIAAPPGAEATATHTRLIVSSLFTLAAALIGAFLTLGSLVVAARLVRRFPSPDR